MIDRIDEIKNYRKQVSQANKESIKKEAFKDLLNRLFAHNPDTKKIVDIITSGAERPIFNIPRRAGIGRGSADTAYSKIIIEFENDLRSTLKHAKEQLAGYLLGQYREGNDYNYTLIASDLITWKVFSIDISSLENLSTLREDEVILNEIETSSFELKNGREDDFYYWIDRFLFREEKEKATLLRIEEAFGNQSVVFRQGYLTLLDYFEKVKASGELQVSYDQWNKSLSIAYDKFNDSTNNFIIHTYLSIFSKMLAYEVISNDPYIEDDEIRGILDGSIFHKLNIENFVEHDFFAWIRVDDAHRELMPLFRSISQELSMFDFLDVDEDILKGVYQDLIDLDTKKSLGEYYTPDWLCERIIQEFDFKPNELILDPSCGSGSFLRAAIDNLKIKFPDAPVEELNAQVHGIDIHPLSVQIAKTTLLLALGKKVREATRPIHLNVILANTLLTPKGIKTFFGDELKMEIDEERLFLDMSIFADARLFDTAIEIADDLAGQTSGKADFKIANFQKAIEQRQGLCITDDQLVEDYFKIYKGLKTAKENGRDSIWRFVIQNLYKPYLMEKKFDYVIGNPPWFTYSSIRNEGYQDILDRLAQGLEVKPERAANYPHLEIAAIFLAHCSNYFLKSAGRIAFVLPRAFFSADHHDNTRKGKSEGFSLTEAWDLDGVSPLFRVPSCVLFGQVPKPILSETGFKREPRREEVKQRNLDEYMANGIPGRSFSGRFREHNATWKQVSSSISERETTYYYLRQGRSSALSERQIANQGENPYKNLFKQGATIVPRNFYFVDIDQDEPPDYNDRILNIRTAADVQAEAKRPWRDFTFDGRIESRFLFRTALSKSILPFAIFKPNLIAIPATVKEDPMGNKELRLHSSRDLRNDGYLHAARWFGETENIWNSNKTEKSKNMTTLHRLNFQNGVTEQNLNDRYLVLYNSSAVNANSTILDRMELDLDFVVESVCYSFSTSHLNEAYFLCAILNSESPNELMKDFQARGLFGARHVHKKILDIYWPRFDAGKEKHIALASLSEAAHNKVTNYLRDFPPDGNLTTHRLGRLRTAIKLHLASELAAIDSLVLEIIT